MIFEIKANDVGKLDDNQFISLLRKLVQAELYKNKIPLRSGTIPAQINIADGGEDGLVSWNGGINETDWLPSRFIIFQSKKGAISPSDLKKETYTKSSQQSQSPKLNEALEKALANSGSYIIVTASAVVGTNVDRRIAKIKEGIETTGNDPSLLSSIQIYDCNRLAEWANTHPSVALWVNSLVQEIHLDGFQTFDDWSKNSEISQIEFQQPDDKRFVVTGIEVNKLKETDETIINLKSFKEIDEIVSTFFLQDGKSVRIIGASGFGKSRFVHHLIASKSNEFQDILDNSQIIYCEYENVKNNLINTIRQIVDKGSKLILIVDDCPDDMHHKLSEIMNRTSSKSIVITIGVETASYGSNNNLVVELQRASDDLIDHISKAINKNINNQNSSLIKELSQGFPRMAIYATQSLDNKDEALSSVDMLIDRIIWGNNERDESSLESLQLLSLFTIVGLENKVSNDLKEIAQFCGKSEDLMYQELTKKFLKRGVLFRQGDYAMVQPLPLAIRLSNQWLENNPTEKLQQLYSCLSNDMKLRLVGRLRWVAWSDKVSIFAKNTLCEALPNYDVINSEFGAKLLERFVHLCPDITMNHLSSLFESKSIDDLLELNAGRYYIVSTLNKLAFRQQTFIPAAILLLKLGAAETESYSNNSSGYFKNLFQLYLSGTEAEPRDKLFVLDEGLSSSDERVRALCVEALEIMLKSHSFTRIGGAEYIGAGKALQDWQPRTQDEIWSYYREALLRLKEIALNVNDENQSIALEYISSHLPNLFSNEGMFDDIKIIISDLKQAYPNWYKPAFQLNTWFYFWRNDVSEEHRKILRAYYDELLPIEILDQIYFYSHQYSRDIHDPDTCYQEEEEKNYDYGNNKIQELINQSPKNIEYFLPLLEKFQIYPTNMASFVVHNIAIYTGQPKKLLTYILDLSSGEKIIAQIDTITNVIAAASKIDPKLGLECMELALQKLELSPFSIEIIKAVGISNELMPRIINLIDEDTVEPYKVNNLIFYDQVDKIKLHWIDELVNSLFTKYSNGGWAAISLLSHILYKTSVPKDLSNCIVKAITNQNLFSQIQHNPMRWYDWHHLTKKVIEGEIDEKWHNQLIDFIFSVINVQEYGIQSSFADYARKILCFLIDISPKLVWDKYIHALAVTANTAIQYRLNNLLIVSFSNPKAPGILSKIPQEIYVPWMEEDKNQRIPLILEWIELFDNANHDSRNIDNFLDEMNNAQYPWSFKFIAFIDKYIDDINQLRILGDRLQNGMWSGSYAHKLNIERDQLIKLKELSKNRYVHQWINDKVSQMESRIANEEKEYQNRHASFLA